MSRNRQRRRLIVHRKYESTRLSHTILEQAYARIIPQYIQVLRAPTGEMEESHEMSQQPQGSFVK